MLANNYRILLTDFMLLLKTCLLPPPTQVYPKLEWEDQELHREEIQCQVQAAYFHETLLDHDTVVYQLTNIISWP